MARYLPGGQPLQVMTNAEFSESLKPVPEAVLQAFNKDHFGFLTTMLLLFGSLRKLTVDDPLYYQARGQAIGHIEAAWLRQEISDEGYDTLIAYVSGGPA